MRGSTAPGPSTAGFRIVWHDPAMIVSTGRRDRHGAFRWVAAAAATLLVAVAACTTTEPPSQAAPTPSAIASAPASGAPSPTAAATPAASASSAAIADCGPSDLKMTGGPWGGAAGSRGADVTVQAGSTACRLPATPVVAMADSTGRDLVHSALPTGGDGPVLEPGASRAFSFRVSNWCDSTARLPLQAVGLVADGAIEIGGLVMTAAVLPPCNGPGQPALVETDGWQ
jgi:hypothetical protein